MDVNALIGHTSFEINAYLVERLSQGYNGVFKDEHFVQYVWYLEFCRHLGPHSIEVEAAVGKHCQAFDFMIDKSIPMEMKMIRRGTVKIPDYEDDILRMCAWLVKVNMDAGDNGIQSSLDGNSLFYRHAYMILIAENPDDLNLLYTSGKQSRKFILSEPKLFSAKPKTGSPPRRHIDKSYVCLHCALQRSKRRRVRRGKVSDSTKRARQFLYRAEVERRVISRTVFQVEEFVRHRHILILRINMGMVEASCERTLGVGCCECTSEQCFICYRCSKFSCLDHYDQMRPICRNCNSIAPAALNDSTISAHTTGDAEEDEDDDDDERDEDDNEVDGEDNSEIVDEGEGNDIENRIARTTSNNDVEEVLSGAMASMQLQGTVTNNENAGNLENQSG